MVPEDLSKSERIFFLARIQLCTLDDSHGKKASERFLKKQN